ncbi:MAG TPA: type VI secretion system-associated protein TagF [Limnobacter sp.]|nr:type VI secretion system-associated protein TagF [Limnobacter sp.]
MNCIVDRKLAWFGKLPCTGDFTCHGMPGEFLSTLDDWLSNLIQQGIQRHGDGWLRAYFNMPVQGFVMRAIPSTENDVVGVWMPSVDRAGRAFPFLLMEFLPCGSCQEPCSVELIGWFVKAAELCSAAMMDEWELKRLENAIRHLPPLSSGESFSVGKAMHLKRIDWYRIEDTKSAHWMMQSAGLPSSTQFNTLMGLKADL